MSRYPSRLVCMTEETTEALYLMGEQHRIVGISGYTVRPPQARKEKPKVSAFTSAKIDKILNLKPDLVLGFSDMQADIAAELIRRGVEVHIFNQRSVEQILQMIIRLGTLIGETEKADRLVADLQANIERYRKAAETFASRPKVYFEEWYEPKICGIQWVSELIEIAGGDDIMAEQARCGLGKDRIIADDTVILERDPDIIIGSWCGRKFRREKVVERPGWSGISAVKQDQLFEIKSADILQPGPACLTDGLRQISDIILAWQG